MKQKYLAVALSTALVASLTACGSEGKSNYPAAPAPAPAPAVPDAKKDDTKKDDAKTDDKTAVQQSNTESKASLGGSLDKKTSVGTQHYIRGKLSTFDTKSNSKNSTGSVANFETLQNTDLANIVIARTTKNRVDDRVDVYLGALENNRQADNALQAFNTQDTTLMTVGNTANNNNGLVSILESAKGVDDSTILGKEEAQSALTKDGEGAVRIFGANFHNKKLDDNNKENIRVYVGNSVAKKAPLTAEGIHTAANLKLLTGKVQLENVQFGRVTANLENVSNITDATDTINGRKYFAINKDNANTYLNVGRNDEKAVNNYFYRGLNETNLVENPQKGDATYHGQALMYGIGNSYRDTDRQTSGGESNSIVKGAATGGKDMLGNFVEARVDFDKKAVVGEVYNVWRLNEIDANTQKNEIKTVTVVNFQGEITGPNSVWGTAKRTGDTVNPVIADFQANFFGKNAEELGGSFNSVRRDAKGVAVYGDATWGGVFGAQKLTAISSEDGYGTE